MVTTLLIQTLKDIKRLYKYHQIRSSGNFSCPPSPLFEDKACTDFFIECLKNSNFYIEYGGGGSTVLAASLGKRVITTESDPAFLREVQKTLSRHAPGSDALVTLIHANIGLVGSWGVPLFRAFTPAWRKKWRGYADAPWTKIQSGHPLPDLVLVDGRFRVACALRCFQALAGKQDAVILVDDYGGRDFYREIERYGELVKMVGRMAVFKPRANDPQKLEQAIAAFSEDFR